MMVATGWLMGLPRQPTPPAAPLGLGLGRSRGRPIALIGQGEPLSLLAPVIALVAYVVSLPAHVVQHGPEIVDPPFKQGGARVCRHESRVSSGYGSFPCSVPRLIVIREGRVNAVQLTRLNRPLAELIPPRTDPARFDAPQDGRFRHAAGFRGLS
jgi:hypothetical protein